VKKKKKNLTIGIDRRAPRGVHLGVGGGEGEVVDDGVLASPCTQGILTF